MKKRILTLGLYLNGMQKRYLKNQYDMTLLFYRSECNYILEKRMRGERLTYNMIINHVFHKKLIFLPNMSDREANTMCEQLLHFQKSCLKESRVTIPNTYIVNDALLYYHWRNVDLFRCLRFHHTWQKEVFRKEWKLIHSALFYQQGHFYVTLTFVGKH